MKFNGMENVTFLPTTTAGQQLLSVFRFLVLWPLHDLLHESGPVFSDTSVFTITISKGQKEIKFGSQDCFLHSWYKSLVKLSLTLKTTHGSIHNFYESLINVSVQVLKCLRVWLQEIISLERVPLLHILFVIFFVLIFFLFPDTFFGLCALFTFFLFLHHQQPVKGSWVYTQSFHKRCFSIAIIIMV